VSGSRALSSLRHPIVLAPLAGGPATVDLAAAVCEAGGLGFLAAGYRRPADVRAEIRDLRARTEARFGVNLFVPGPPAADPDAVARYTERLRPEAERLGVEVGAPRHDDDGWEAKLELVLEERPAVVSFTFGCPPADVLRAVRDAGCETWVTVTDRAEARTAKDAGADALVLQGAEAGGHRASFADAAEGDALGILPLLRLVAGESGLPLVAAGGVADGPSLAAVLAGGADAAQVGTPFLRAYEAGTHPAHRAALAGDAPTAVTRAFTGRTARGIVNRFMREHGQGAPAAYPELHHATAPLRAAARERGDAGGFNLWAGQAHRLAEERPAAEIVRELAAGARAALARAGERF
jgi:nitronate monooxygenase